MNASHIDLVRQNFIAKVSYYAQLGLPDTAFVETEALAVVDSGLPTDTFNVIVPKPMPTEALASPLCHQLQHFTGKHFPVALWCWNDILSPELAHLLTQYGLYSEESDVAMWLNLQNAAIAKPTLQGLQIHPVQTSGEYEQFADVIAELFGDSSEADQIRLYHQKISRVHSATQPMKLHIGIADGNVVATGTLFLSDTSAGIYDLATRPAWRGRGFGSQLFQHLIWLATQHSATQVVLQASADGLGIYKRAGFLEVGLVRVFGNRHVSAV
ncbi:GNAT family N-acetyltransferase [Spirosoma sp. SC4-14]|uniref:GNAT family N-acetyltransferase n=1 Tax=Spirosoma sp. SC4-14 TaxID=3128900 RepID=UPI0030CC2F07